MSQALVSDTLQTDTSTEHEQKPVSSAVTRGPIDHKKTVAPFNYALALQRVAEESGKGFVAQIVEMLRLLFGRGKILPFNYYYYGLYDDALSMAEKSAFVGSNLRAKMSKRVLNNELYGVGLDKAVFYACMTGLGLPVPETRAIFHPERPLGGAVQLRSQEALEQYLRQAEHYPLFCKPCEQTASLGSAALERYHGDADEVELSDGRRYSVATFATEAGRYFATGYLIQKRLQPHPEISRIVGGNSLSTVRIMILRDEGVLNILGATWRLPVGGNPADVYWRGNMMAALDPASGEAFRVITGLAMDLTAVERHPDTGVQVRGATFPMWDEVRDLALRAATALPKLELTGWDIALTTSGPVLIELEPDGGEPAVTQLATRKGLLDGPYGAFLRRRMTRKRR